MGPHQTDLLAAAGTPVPDDLAPLDPNACPRVVSLVRAYLRLAQVERDEIRRLVAALPQEERTHPARTLVAHHLYSTSPGPGAALMRMLANRNLGWTQITQMFLAVTGRYWSASTYEQVGRGQVPVTPDLLVDFSVLLGVPAAELATLTGVPLEHETPPTNRAAEGVSELIWDARRLTADQVQYVYDVARSMRQ
ncbi:hypothetical protein [Actinokineospora sp. HUAS TT18]|uniref:hypothetical protein n=1 Tax=Actinokineospora sp. HUAS TT18 TaxID=3447451 RepID=UPI003F528B85